jgi:putative endonuclease
MFYVYQLENEQGETYIGFSSDLRKRLVEHNLGKTFSTKGEKWKCIYYEACIEESDARRREKYLKTSQGRRMLKLRIKDHLYKRRASRNFTNRI